MLVRLYIKDKLEKKGQIICLDEKQSHYLVNVLRLRVGDEFFVFDGSSGEYKAEITDLNKRAVTALLTEKVCEMQKSPDIWLLFAPLKKDKTDIVVQKATELGVRKIIPVQTAYTNAEKVRTERFELQAAEAAEQCRRLDIPDISAALSFDKALENWDNERTLFFLDERGLGKKVRETMLNSPKAAVLVGPEGGFSLAEAEKLRKLPFVKSISLGSRILRAETAVIAALSCWQSINGDW